MRAIAYLRVSSEEQARSGLGLEAQRERLAAEIDRRAWDVIWIEDRGKSARSLRRDGLSDALQRLRTREAEVLLATSVDRISRSTVDFGRLLERARKERWSIVALDIGLDMSTATGEMVASVVAAIGQWESRRIGERTSDAMQAAKRRGTRLGGPRLIPDDVRSEIATRRRAGWSLRKIARHLDDSGVPTARGTPCWHPASVAAVLNTLRGAQDESRGSCGPDYMRAGGL